MHKLIKYTIGLPILIGMSIGMLIIIGVFYILNEDSSFIYECLKDLWTK